MATREERLTREISEMIVRRMHEERLGLYPAMRILGYAMVMAAECLDLEGAADNIAE